ncbi:MAG: motility protein A [Bythopirellula sp.]|nr:motility protein A [Bythopirellula sp.]
MDIATLLGIAVAVSLIVSSITLGGGSFAAFLDLPSAMIVFGGAMAAALVSFPLRNFVGVFRVAAKALFYRLDSVPQLVEEIVTLAEMARRHGLLSLETRLGKIRHPFLVLGVQLVVDGTRPDVMEDILRTEQAAVAHRHRDGKAVLDCMGRFAPAFGMIGTLMGLVMMLGNMRDPSKIGSGMAVALLTTLYGALAANVVFLPVAEKLKFTSKQELQLMELILRGIMAIHSGEHPRVIEQKLRTFHPERSLSEIRPVLREEIQQEKRHAA